MTTRSPRNTTALTKGQAVDRIASLHESAEERYHVALAELRDADGQRMRAILARVPAADREAAERMLAALGIELPETPRTDGRSCFDVARDGDIDEPAVGDVVEDVPSRTPLDELPRGAQPYTPSAVAQAAMKGRR